MTRQYRRIQIATSALGLCLFAAQGLAQDALGTGNALDASPSVRGRLNTERPSFAAELQFRNAIATGNAPGGLSFRGDLGYRAAGEFTGALGSDTLFSFRRDSLYSGLAGMGIRGTEAVQYQFALTTGGRPPSDLMGNLAVSRDFGSPASASSLGNPSNNQPLGIDHDSQRLDPSGQALSVLPPERDDGSMLGTLRSSSSYLSTASMQPVLLSIYGEGVERTPYGVTASNLRGVTSTPMYTNAFAHQRTEEDDDTPRPGSEFRTTINELAQKQVERAKEMLADRSNPADREDADPEVDWFTKRMQELREELYGVNPDADPNTINPDEDPDNPDAENQDDEGTVGGSISTGIDIPGAVENTDELSNRIRDMVENDPTTKPYETDEDGSIIQPAVEGEDDGLELSPEILAILRNNGDPVNNFVGRDVSTKDVYADHIRTGERLIGSERYFDAEERFTRALAIRPGDITAQIGRIHAQIGAGMVLSGSVNLQQILTDFPQLAGTRYSSKLLPAPDRIAILKEGLRMRAGLIEVDGQRLHDDARVRLASGLLLGYLGYQTLDQSAVDDGLGVMKEVGSDADRRLARLLEQIWDTASAEPIKDHRYGADTDE